MLEEEDELVPLEPFIFETDPVAQEEAATQELIPPNPASLAPITDEHAEDHQQDDQEF